MYVLKRSRVMLYAATHGVAGLAAAKMSHGPLPGFVVPLELLELLLDVDAVVEPLALETLFVLELELVVPLD